MKLCKKPDYFLVTEYWSTESREMLFIDSQLSIQMKKWNVRTKIASCFRILGDGLHTDKIKLVGVSYVFFIGPVSIEKFNKSLLKDMSMWLTYGAYNLIILTQDEKKSIDLINYLESQRIRYEKWDVDNNEIIKYKISCRELVKRTTLSNKLFDNYKKDSVMLPVVREYYTQMHTACERLRYIDVASYNRMLRFHESVEEYVLDKADGKDDSYQNFNYLTSINACLTRYNSQMVSGFSPILKQETHAWSHSLLGMGMASIAINNLGDFFYDKVGNQHIAERFIQLLSKPYQYSKSLTMSAAKDAAFQDDHIGTEIVSPIEQMPLLIFFSSRDGFRNQYNTLSIPLISLYGCNTPGWSLKTISHEASHILVDNVLDFLFKDIQQTDFQQKLSEYSYPTYKPKTYEEAILQLLGSGLLALSAEDGEEYDGPRLRNSFEYYRDEMKEIMTHAFDFLYFYHSNIRKYIEEIWVTWGELPRISASIPDYIMRSLCIIVLSAWDVENIETKAIELLKEELVKLTKNIVPVFKNQYLKDAIDYIDCHKEDKNGKLGLNSLLVRRKFLIKFVRGFLFSEDIHSIIAHEEYRLGSKAMKENINSFTKLEIPNIPFNNPLTITELYAQSTKISEAQSCLIYYILSFNYVRDRFN